MNDTKLRIYQLKNTQCSMQVIAPDITDNMRAILISDVHIGKFTNPDPQLIKLKESLTALVNRHSANCVIALGDTLDIAIKNTMETGQKFLDLFADFPVPYYFISGNHDRGIYRKLNVHGVMHYYPEMILKLVHKNPNCGPLFLAHDFGNNYRLKPETIPSFIWSNKVAQKDKIKESDMLIIGHVHRNYYNKEKKIASIGTFSFEFDNYCYGLLEYNDMDFTFSLHDIEE